MIKCSTVSNITVLFVLSALMSTRKVSSIKMVSKPHQFSESDPLSFTVQASINYDYSGDLLVLPFFKVTDGYFYKNYLNLFLIYFF